MPKEVLAKSRTKHQVASQKAPVAAKGRDPRPIYALKQWSVERRSRGWYISTTHGRFSAPATWHGPYCSIASACLAISKKLAKEARERYRRHCVFHGVEDDTA